VADIPDGHMFNQRIGKINRFMLGWHNGRKDLFPICCILRFSFEDAWHDGKIVPIEKGPAKKRGGFYRGNIEDDDVFVPCGIFHQANSE
jgi:hypothetical protein